MLRVFIGYFLLLCALLSSGYSILSPLADLSSNPFQTLNADYSQIMQGNQFVLQSPCVEKNLTIGIAENELEEDEQVVSKKHVGNNGNVASVFFGQTIRYVFGNSKKMLSFYRYFSYGASSQYLRFQVFRIWCKYLCSWAIIIAWTFHVIILLWCNEDRQVCLCYTS